MTNPTACREAFEKWADEYGLIHEPNFSPMTRADCLAAFKAAWNTRAPKGDAVNVRDTPEYSYGYQQAIEDGLLQVNPCPNAAAAISPSKAVEVKFTDPRATSDEVERDAASLVKSVQKDAQSVFEEYVLANYPDGCVIARASWHAPRLFRAAVYAIDAALANRGEE